MVSQHLSKLDGNGHCDSVDVSDHPAKFRDHRYYGKKGRIVSICHMITQPKHWVSLWVGAPQSKLPSYYVWRP